MHEQVDLSEILKRGTVSLEPEEHPDDRAARIRREDRAAKMEHFYNVAMILGLVVLAVFFALNVYSGDPQIAELARNGLAAIASGVIGFVTGRKIGKGK